MEVLIYIASLLDMLAAVELPVSYTEATYWVLGAIAIALIVTAYD